MPKSKTKGGFKPHRLIPVTKALAQGFVAGMPTAEAEMLIRRAKRRKAAIRQRSRVR